MLIKDEIEVEMDRKDNSFYVDLSRPPQLDMYYLMGVDYELLNLLRSSLHEIYNQSANFFSALTLFDEALKNFEKSTENNLQRYMNRSWMHLACRDSIFSIYHFAVAMEGVKFSYNKMDNFRIDNGQKSLKEASKMFSKQFPKYNDIRDAVGHITEYAKHPSQFSKHAFSGTFESKQFNFEECANVTIKDYLSGRTYTNTFNGKILEYEMSPESLRVLFDIKGIIFRAINISYENFKKQNARVG